MNAAPERRIDAVVRVRALQERLARAAVARARAEAAEAVTLEREAWELLVARDRELRGAFTGADMVVREGVLAGGLQHGLRAARHASSARAASDAAIEGWAATARAHEGVARLAERIAEEVRLDHARKEAVELDELVVVRYGGHR